MHEWVRLWAYCSPETKSFLVLTLAGVLGALVNTALEHRPVVLPHVGRGGLHLGFLGTLIISVVAAHAVDHSFGTALLAAVCGSTTLRRLKAEIDRGFERENPQVKGERRR